MIAKHLTTKERNSIVGVWWNIELWTLLPLAVGWIKLYETIDNNINHDIIHEEYNFGDQM